MFDKKLGVISFVLMIVLMGLACAEPQTKKIETPKKVVDKTFNKKTFHATLERHLKAVSNRDVETLKSTMHPEGKMQLILPATEIMTGVDAFMNYHEEWFKMPNWTFETKILNIEVGETNGIGITEVIYREPLRDGKPYFNRMTVSYALEKFNGTWYIIKDHASSIEKSTDQ